MTDVRQKVQRTSIFVEKLTSLIIEVRSTVTFHERYFSRLLGITKHYLVGATNIKVRCTSA